MTSSKRRRQRPWEALRAFSVGQEPPKQCWRWPWPQTWGQVYAVIIGLLVGFLALAYALDWLKQALGH